MQAVSSGSRTSAPTAQVSPYAPMRILELELGGPLTSISAVDEKTGNSYQQAMCLIRLHRQPLGIVELRFEEKGMEPEKYMQDIWLALSAQMNVHLQHDGLEPVAKLDAEGMPAPDSARCREERAQFLANAPYVSVIVPTHNRPDRLQICLQSLLALDYPRYEIIIVDNAPASMETAELIERTYCDVERVRYLREDRVGASRARNRGIREARGEILAFADDDVVVDANWLTELVRAFRATEDVACVTGLLLPLELEERAQFWIEEFGGFSKGFERRIYDMKEHHPGTPLHPFAAGQFGTGANMAFTAAFLRKVGGFDTALGPGNPSQGGEDLTLFFQAITRGHRLVYEPGAVAYHPHHREYSALRKQIYSYGVGLTAYLTRNVLTNPRLLWSFVTKIPYGLYFAINAGSSKNRKKSRYYPKELTRLELKGMLYGPFAYLRSRWKARHRHEELAPGGVENRSARGKGKLEL